MKISEILTETPYHHDGVMAREKFGTSYTSDVSLERLYQELGEIKAKDDVVRLYLQNTKDNVIGVIKREKPDTKVETNAMIFTLRFKKRNTIDKMPAELKGHDILQVTKVSIDPSYEGVGIASLAYALLVAKGYVVISDSSQFTDGKMLWKKLAKEAKLKDYKVYILDDHYGFKKVGGKLVEYDASNIDNADIWTKGEDLSGEHILLVMK
jgi:hypothetical protein